MKRASANASSPGWRRAGAGCAIVALGFVLTACQEPEPRSFNDFMEDRIAMEGTLARCSRDRAAAQFDIECANASRAQVALALEAERERREQYERESERKIEQLTREMAAAERRAREVAREAIRRQLEAYENMWGSADESSDPDAGTEAGELSDRSGEIALSGHLLDEAD